MTPPTPRKTPAPATPGAPPIDGPQAPDDVGILATKVAQNPAGFDTTLDVSRVPINGDSRNAVWVAEMPRDNLSEAHRWLAKNVGAGTFRVQARTVDRGFAGSAIVSVGVDNRDEDQRRRAPSPAAVPPPPAAPQFDLAAVMVGMMQQQSAMFTAMLGARKDGGDDLERLERLQKLVAHKDGPDTKEVLNMGLDLGAKLAKVGGFGKLLDEHGGAVVGAASSMIEAIAARIKRAPVTVPSTPVQPAAVEQPVDEAAAAPADSQAQAQEADEVIDPPQGTP